MKLPEDFLREAVTVAYEECARIYQEGKLSDADFLKNYVFAASYSILVQYHYALRDALKENGIDIGILE